MENKRVISPFVSNGIASTEKYNPTFTIINQEDKDNSCKKFSSRNDNKDLHLITASLTP